MNVDRLLQVLETAQILIDGLAAAIGLTVLGLSASVISFANLYKNAYLSVKFYWKGKTWDQGQPYLPPNYNEARPALLIVTGIICMLVNVPLIAWRLRRDNLTRESRKAFLLIAAALGFALLFTLAVTIYSWLQILNGQHRNDWIWRFADGYDHPIIWNNSISFDALSWNCALYPYLYPNGPNSDQGLGLPGYAAFRGLCYQGIAALDLLLALPILEAAALSLHVWANKKRLGRPLSRLNDGEPDAYKMDDLQGLVQDR